MVEFVAYCFVQTACVICEAAKDDDDVDGDDSVPHAGNDVQALQVATCNRESGTRYLNSISFLLSLAH